jgi:hypothetical protein
MTTTADLLESWRDATRAAELAERLALVATKNAERANLNADEAEEVAVLAEQAAASAAAAGERARRAADQARLNARQSADVDLVEANAQHDGSRTAEVGAKAAYHDAEAAARARHGADTPSS